ncbi:MAG: PilZ domain-containing protein [Thermodesulfobacteriota bacterium]|nr:PilZ domain-containing protein [Thermodesulfobacteriota bacterium]
MTDAIGLSTEASPVRARLRELVADISLIIEKASEEEHLRLLGLLQSPGLMNMLRAWQKKERRKASRKPWPEAVTCTAKDGAFKGFIQNISNGGVFIETPRTFSVGQELTLIFSPTSQQGPFSVDQEGPIKITGKILWRVPRGIGIKFETASDDLEEILRSL